LSARQQHRPCIGEQGALTAVQQVIVAPARLGGAAAEGVEAVEGEVGGMLALGGRVRTRPLIR
jgi:hypothetical protein